MEEPNPKVAAAAEAEAEAEAAMERSPADPPPRGKAVDIFDLFDILARVGIVEEEEDEEYLASRAAAAAARAAEAEKKKKKRPPFGCRERNVVQCRHYVDLTEEELAALGPPLREVLLDIKARALADQAEDERARLEYLDRTDAC